MEKGGTDGKRAREKKTEAKGDDERGGEKEREGVVKKGETSAS